MTIQNRTVVPLFDVDPNGSNLPINWPPKPSEAPARQPMNQIYEIIGSLAVGE